MLNDDLELITKRFENTSFFIDNIEKDNSSDEIILNIKANNKKATMSEVIKIVKDCFVLSEHIKEITFSKTIRIRRKQVL